MTTKSDDWIEVKRDAETGIESIHAHFQGHAYDAHAHDELLVGITQQGVQQFRCNRALHTSVPGDAMLAFAISTGAHANCLTYTNRV